MTQQELQASGFVYLSNERRIQPIVYLEYLHEYGRDLTTSPNGVAGRIHVRKVFINENPEYQIWSWGTGGNHPFYTGRSFDNKEDALLYYYEGCECYAQSRFSGAPIWYETYAEAVTEMANSLDRSEKVVRRYIAIGKITARKDAEHRAQVSKEYAERKARLVISAPKEADSILIDREFCSAIASAKKMCGQEKSVAIISAVKGLLERNNKDQINSDFWQVARILKAKAERL